MVEKLGIDHLYGLCRAGMPGWEEVQQNILRRRESQKGSPAGINLVDCLI